MARWFETYGTGVAGMPFWLRCTLTGALLVPLLLWISVGVVLAPPADAIAFLMAFFFAVPAYLVIPRFWDRTGESVLRDWEARRVQRWLEQELGQRERARDALCDPERPLPRRW